MASEKLTDLGAIPILSATDSVYVVDASDTTDDAAGSSKKITAAALGARYLIEEITLGTAGEFDFDSIPAGFNRLIIKGTLRGDVVADDFAQLIAFINATTTGYIAQSVQGYSGAANGNEFTDGRVGICPGGNSPANYYGDFELSIEDYTGSHYKIMTCRSYSARNATESEIRLAAARSTVTAAVTRIRIRTDNHPTEQLVGALRLYGEF